MIMKKMAVLIASLFVLFPLHAADLATGLEFSGGVKTGIMMQNRDFGGKLGNLALGPEHKFPLTLFFASQENGARNGEGWLSFGYSWNNEGIGSFGLRMGFWAHGDINNFSDIMHLGDHYLWAYFFNEKLRFIGGQGGDTPIKSGGWINADWLGYTGLRFFWVDPIGLSVGINFPDPGAAGIKPVNYLSLLSAGASYKYNNWLISLQFSNSPIYDDTESNYYGGLHRPEEQDPIAMAGNIAFGTSFDKLYGGKGFLAIEGLFSNLGEDDLEGLGEYTISPVSSSFAVKTGYPFLDKFYVELKGKYTLKQGDNDNFSKAIYWGKLELEPYFSYQPFDFLSFHLAVYGAFYINSYYLALDWNQVYRFNAGQVPSYNPLLDYLSPYQITVKPKVNFKLSGIDIDLGYEGSFSRDHTENTVFIDFRWMF